MYVLTAKGNLYTNVIARVCKLRSVWSGTYKWAHVHACKCVKTNSSAVWRIYSVAKWSCVCRVPKSRRELSER